MTTDPIAAARALIEPLTGYTPGPWRAVSDHPLNACANVRAGHHDVATLYGGCEDVPQPVEGEPWGPHPIRDATSRLIAAAPDLRDMVASLADALDAERAKVAAAYEAAASIARSHIYYDSAGSGFREDEFDNTIRALAPADAQAALDKLLAKALEIERAKVAAAFAMQDAGYSITTSSDAQAALDKMLAEARVEGWRAGRDAAANSAETVGFTEVESPLNDGLGTTVFRPVRGYDIAAIIRALPEPQEESHE